MLALMPAWGLALLLAPVHPALAQSAPDGFVNKGLVGVGSNNSRGNYDNFTVPPGETHVLMDEKGILRTSEVQRLWEQRDDRPMAVNE